MGDIETNNVSIGQTFGDTVTHYVFVLSNVTEDISVEASFVAILATNDVPHWWLAEHGLTNGFDAETMRDHDEDGHAAWEEFIAGTDPRSAESVLEISGIDGSVNVAISWPSVSNRVYDLFKATNLLTGFNPAAGNMPATPPKNAYTDSVGTAKSRFYRIRVK